MPRSRGRPVHQETALERAVRSVVAARGCPARGARRIPGRVRSGQPLAGHGQQAAGVRGAGSAAGFSGGSGSGDAPSHGHFLLAAWLWITPLLAALSSSRDAFCRDRASAVSWKRCTCVFSADFTLVAQAGLLVGLIRLILDLMFATKSSKKLAVGNAGLVVRSVACLATDAREQCVAQLTIETRPRPFAMLVQVGAHVRVRVRVSSRAPSSATPWTRPSTSPTASPDGRRDRQRRRTRARSRQYRGRRPPVPVHQARTGAHPRRLLTRAGPPVPRHPARDRRSRDLGHSRGAGNLGWLPTAQRAFSRAHAVARHAILQHHQSCITNC